MNILSIDTDFRLAMDPEKVMGDSQAEAALWGSQLAELWIIAFSFKKQNLQFKRISHNVSVYPTSSYSVLRMPLDALHIGQKICKSNKIDLVTTKDPFLTGLSGLWLKNKFHIPLNIRLHNNSLNNKTWLQERWWLNRGFNSLGNFILKRADSVLAVHPAIAKNIRGCFKNRGLQLFCLEHDVGIDVDNFQGPKGEHVREKILQNIKKKLILYAGRLEPEKNLKNLFLAMKRIVPKHPEALLVILGEGRERQNLTKTCQALGLQTHVRFHESVPYTQMPDYIGASDVVVLPSNHEGGGRIILEALLMGRPVVATDVGFARGIIRDGKDGYVVAFDNPGNMAEALIQVLNTPLLKDSGEEYLIDLRQKFSRKNITPDIITVWDRTRKIKQFL